LLRRVKLDVSALLLNQFLELPLHGVEGSSHHGRQLFVKVSFAGIANCH
jgi:hypothetical protein